MLGFIMLLFFLLLIFIRTQKGQDIIRKEAVSYLTKKLGTSVSIGQFRSDILSHIEIQCITVEDQSHNILLHIGKIETNYRLFALLKNTLFISQLSIDTLDFRMAREQNDTTYNFDFIIRAFSGAISPETSVDTPGKPLTLNVEKLMVNQLHFVMDDKYGHQFYDVKSKLIAANIDELDLEHQLYKIESIETESLEANLNLGTSALDTSAESAGLLPQIIINKITLLNSHFSVQMPGAGYQSESKINNFYAEGLNLNLNSNKADLRQLLIDQHQSQMLIKTIKTKPQSAKSVQLKTAESSTFAVTIGSIILKDNDLKYDRETKAVKVSSDFNQEHIHLKEVQLQLEDFAFEGPTLQGNVIKFQAKEQCGLDIQQFSTGFQYADTGVILDKFLFKTSSSYIDGNFRINYESLASISNNPGLLGLEIELEKMLIASDDMKHFRTTIGNNPDIRKLLSNNIYLEGKLKGKVADMTIENLKLKTSELTLSASGKIAGLPDPNKLLATINLKEFSGTTKSLAKLLPAGSIPPNIAENESFNLKGKLGDNKGAYTFDLVMNSSAGNLALDGNVNQLNNEDKLSYNVHALSDGLLLNRILMDTLYGNTAFNIQLNGKGISPETAESNVVALIPTVRYRGYDYKTINLKATISASVVDANFQIQDSAFNTSLVAHYCFDSLHPLLAATAHIVNLDLRRIGFITDTMKFKGDIVADLTNVNAKHINGTIRIPHVEITKAENVYKLDSISLEAVNIDSTQTIAIKSSFFHMNMDGYYEINALPDIAQNLLIDFLTVHPPTGTIFKPAYAKLNGELRFHPVIPAFVPGLISFKTLNFGGTVNTKEKDLMFTFSLPGAFYKDFIIDSTAFGFRTLNDTLQYVLDSYGLKNSSITLDHSLIDGNARDGIINWDIKLYNRNDSLKYNLAGNIINDTTKFVLHLNEDQLINSERWNANADNQTEYTATKNIHTNLTLSSGMRQLSLQSSPVENGLPLDLKLIDFPITTLTKIISADTTMAAGTINGIASVISFEPLLFTANLKIDSLKAYNVDAGNLILKANNEPGVGYNAHVNLLGPGNDVDLNASYSDKGELSGKLGIGKFNIQTLDPFLKSMISGLKGSLNGSVAFEGTIDEPVVIGEINIQDLQGNYRDYNTFFKAPDEKIQFNRNGMSLNEFVVYDSIGNTAKVNGQIHTSDYRNYNYDLKVKTDHFMALNKKFAPDQEYYGPAYFTSDLLISSAANVLSVKGNVKVDEKSELNIEMSSVDTTIANSNGIIIYVDSLQKADSGIFNALKIEMLKHAPSLKIGLAINLEIDKTSKLNIFLDNTGGDFMKVAGDANLTISQQPGGQMDMQGKFIIDNGEYQMTLSHVIKRKFIVQQGSSIQWNGSPTDADVDLTALYNVKTTAEAILAGSQTTNKGAYKQVLPFEVYLMLKKKLLQPAISFRLDMPVKEQNAFSGVVYSRIKQINLNESELNKQVMGLLFINQFVPADPLASGSGSVTQFDYESVARSTAGSLVSSQLNSLISSRIKTVDVNFDVESKADYSTGIKTNQTDLNVNLSKTLLNDRYIISVGSTFALEGSEEHKKNTSGLAGNYSAEYKITKDGRYRAKFYRKDQYEADNSGQVIQTGISIVLFIDFNKYRDIFKKKKKELK